MVLTSTACGLQFANGAIGLIDSGVRLGACAGVGIGDRDPAERLSSDHPRLLPLFPIWIEERVGWVMFVSVTVRPAVHRDGLDVPRRIEIRAAQHPSQLIADVAFKFRKWRLHQLVTSRAVLFARGQTRLAGSTEHEEHHGLFRRARKAIVTKTDRKIEHGITVITSRRNNVTHSELVERCPITNRNMRIDQRHFYEVRQRLFLLLWKL